MDANVNDGCRGSDGCGRDDERRPWQFAEVDVCLWNLSAAHWGGNGMTARVAGVGPHCRVVVCRVVVLLG